MSLTTVASTIRPDQTLEKLPPSRPERFLRSDFVAAAFVFIITLGVYIATMAPSVTLEDSGELITGAVDFGVPHPPGYPLWTISGFLLSRLFEFGNMAWRINLESAIFGAAANAVLTLLVCHSGRWLLQRWTDEKTQPIARRFCFYAGMTAGLIIGFSDVMWSQAVIAEVYTLNALFVNLTLLLFYLWMLEPQKTHRLIFVVLVFALGLTNHHTLVQVIPAFLIAAFVIEFVPIFRGKVSQDFTGLFFSVFIAVNLFSLSILVYISSLASGDPNESEKLQTISQVMAKLIFVMTAVISFVYLRKFQWKLFLLGAGTAVAIFAYGFYVMGPSESNTVRYAIGDGPFWRWATLVHPGWLQGLVANARAGVQPVARQVDPVYAWTMLLLAAGALGLLYTSALNRRMVIGFFVAGWIGLMPYAYERFASATNPPMNWGFTSERNGFYYEVTREQYPKSLPTLIKLTFGKALGIIPKDEALDATIGLPNYYQRLGLSFYYYAYNLQDNVTVPLIFLVLASLLYLRRSDWSQVSWFIFLGCAFFFLGFMLQLIAPQEDFDYQHNLQYKVFHLQSHCIFVILIGYGMIAGMTYLYENLGDYAERLGVPGFGIVALSLALLPLWSNFNDCNQWDHWWGYDFGADMMRDMDRNAVYYGGSDPGRFVPTYMAFVESQQPSRWKREPDFDRRDVAVITQNALCDAYYSQYIRNQYDDRFRTKPDNYSKFEKWLGRNHAYPVESVTCLSNEELLACWDEYQNMPDVVARVKAGGPALRPGSNDVFTVNGIVAEAIFEKNKQKHTFYLEQSVPMPWTYPYMQPWGLIFKLTPEKQKELPKDMIDRDRKFWDAYSAKLLANPDFRLDDDAPLTFGKLALWHADLYRFYKLDAEEEHWLRISLALCPQLPDTVRNLCTLLAHQKRFDEALAVAQQAQLDDPLNDTFRSIYDWLVQTKSLGLKEQQLRDKLATSPYDLGLNLDLAQTLQDEGKYEELNDRLRIAAGLTNWTPETMGALVQYYVDRQRNPDAALAFLEARVKIDPKTSELVYNLAALHAQLNHRDEAMKYLEQAAAVGGTNALIAAGLDPSFNNLRDDPRFQALLGTLPPMGRTNMTTAPATNHPAAEEIPAVLPPSTSGPGVRPPQAPPGKKKAHK